MARIRFNRSSRANVTQRESTPHEEILHQVQQTNNDNTNVTNRTTNDNSKPANGDMLRATPNEVNTNQQRIKEDAHRIEKVEVDERSSKPVKKHKRSPWRLFYIHSSCKKPVSNPTTPASPSVVTDSTPSSSSTTVQPDNATEIKASTSKTRGRRAKKDEQFSKQETKSSSRLFSSKLSTSDINTTSNPTTDRTNEMTENNKPNIITNSSNKQVISTHLPPYEIEVTTIEGLPYIECPLCVLLVNYNTTPSLKTCSHRTCLECMQLYLKNEINHSRLKITCPICPELLQQQVIREVLHDDKCYFKYESFMLRKVLAADPDARWCPAPDCGYAVLATGCASCPRLVCAREGCNTEFCYHCKQEWHPNQTCSAASIQRNKRNGFVLNAFNISDLISSADESPRINQQQQATSNDASDSIDDDRAGTHVRLADGKDKDSLRKGERKSSRSSQQAANAAASNSLRPEDIKECPVCSSRIIKMNDGSCNHMTCSICETDFCWLCMKEITDLHYFSPSGCTFWGKKPWSRKKKLLWRLGMLVGAPICIVFVAGIAVPAIVIGIPVWAARKLHTRLEKREFSRYRKNAIITGGVLLSFVVSPIISIMALAVGIPLLLGYVYGVVPLSLCRSSGGCLSASSSVDDLQQSTSHHHQSMSQQQSIAAAAALASSASASSVVNQARDQLQRLQIQAAQQEYKRQQMKSEQQKPAQHGQLKQQQQQHKQQQQQQHQLSQPHESRQNFSSNINQATPPPYSDVISVDTATNNSKLEVSFGMGNGDSQRQQGGCGGSSIGEPSMYMSNISLETNSIGNVTNIIERSSRHSASGTGGCGLSTTGCEVDHESASNVVLTGSMLSHKIDGDAQSTRALAGSIVSKESGGYTLVPAEVHTSNNSPSPNQRDPNRSDQQHSQSLYEDNHHPKPKTGNASSVSANDRGASMTRHWSSSSDNINKPAASMHEKTLEIVQLNAINPNS